jgi:E3 ubiquitin-protein ligase MARCH6
MDEQDTCRICRGEGSIEEPLFYPCKCSGSIKFVHQGCLMEWLSHSQKKHCELCKTPFRFTKLYHSEMPQTLPTPIFLRELVVHALRAIVTWLRFLLVAFVWLACLPFSMRTVWRALFWAADGTWGVKNAQSRQALNNKMASAAANLTELAANGTTPRQNPFLPTSDPSAIIYVVNLVASIPLSAASQVMGFFTSHIYNSPAPEIPNAPANHSRLFSPSRRDPSWLSEMKVLQDLSPYSRLNNAIIDILEGQLITLLVVVAFILVFLIREWVVQQQPAINLAAEAEAELQERPRADEARIREIAQFHAQLRADRLRQEAQDDNNLHADDDINNRDQGGVIRDRLIAVPRPRIRNTTSQHSLNQQQESKDASEVDREDDSASGSTSSPELGREEYGLVHGTWKEAANRADEPQKQEWPGVRVFMDLWRRSDGDPDQVLRIIQAEERESDLGWVVLAMKRLKERNERDESRVPRPALSLDNIQESLGNARTVEEKYQIPDSMVWKPFPLNPYATVTPPGTPPIQVAQPDFDFRNSAPNFGLDSNDSVSSSIVNLHADSEPGNYPNESLDEDDSPTIPALLTPSTETPSPSDKGKQVDIALINADATFTEDAHIERMQDAINETDTIEQAVSKFVQDSTLAGTSQPQSIDIETMSNNSMQVNLNQAPSDYSDGPKRSMSERLAQWLWGQDLSQEEAPHAPAEDDGDDEHVVQDLADEEPFVPIAHNHIARNDRAEAEDSHQQVAPEVQQAAHGAQANPNPNEIPADPNDPEAVEEAEDLEGIMELIGMQGPILGLVQNGLFSALLVSITVATAIWLPYVWGKVALLLLANPLTLFVKLPLRTISLVADTLFDVALFMSGCMIYWVNGALHVVFGMVGRYVPVANTLAKNTVVATASRTIAETSLQRLVKVALGSALNFSESDFAAFSILSHEALQMFKQQIFDAIQIFLQVLSLILYETPLRLLGHGDKIEPHHEYLAHSLMSMPVTIGRTIKSFSRDLPSLVSRRRLITVSLDNSPGAKPLNYDLADWDTKDRILTVILGYLFFTSCGIIYLKLARFMSGTRRGQKVEGIIADTLQQAGGVTKVILIIGIEMIVFPLYCGLLLDAALLPLFENVTLSSRVNFTLQTPCTSLFVHWFIGTCYMFHFALFVSMCRKIMRSGVLCKLNFSYGFI